MLKKIGDMLSGGMLAGAKSVRKAGSGAPLSRDDYKMLGGGGAVGAYTGYSIADDVIDDTLMAGDPLIEEVKKRYGVGDEGARRIVQQLEQRLALM